MTEFYLTSEAIKNGRLLILKRSLFFMLVLTVGGFCYSYLVLHAGFRVAVATTLLLNGITLFSYFYNIQQQKLLIQSYCLLLEPTALSRSQLNIPTIRLAAGDITGITQDTEGILTIASADKYQSIYVPFQVTNRFELLQHLEHFAPITILAHKSFVEKLAPFISIIMIGLMGLFYTANNKFVSTSTGIILLSAIAYSAWHIWRNKNITQQARRLLWFLPIAFISILVGIVTKLIQ